MDKEQLIQLIDEIAERLEGPAQYIFELAIRQQYVIAYTWMAALVFGLTGSIFFARLGIREDAKDSHKQKDWKIGLSVIGTALFGFLSIVAGAAIFTEVIPRLVNPEFMALKDLIPGL